MFVIFLRVEAFAKHIIFSRTHFGQMQVPPLEINCHALHGFDIQPQACRSVQPYRRPTNLPHLPKTRRRLPHAVRLQPHVYI